MKIGAHVSAGGGLPNTPERAAALGLECFQFFSRSPQGGRVPALGQKDAAFFRKLCEQFGFNEYYIHAPYVINLASPVPRIRENSIEIMRSELERGTLLGVSKMMTHVGSANGVDRGQGVALVIDGINRILDGYDGSTRFLVEISAGAGSVIGCTFEEVRDIVAGVGHEMLGICFDTAHAFASGYDLRTAESVAATMKKFDTAIGLDRLELSHCNDSLADIGERKDRHANLGDGRIGVDGFRAIMDSPAFSAVNLILETPHEDVAKDIALLKRLRNEK